MEVYHPKVLSRWREADTVQGGDNYRLRSPPCICLMMPQREVRPRQRLSDEGVNENVAMAEHRIVVIPFFEAAGKGAAKVTVKDELVYDETSL